MPAPTHVGLLYWYTTTAILGLLAIINLACKLQANLVGRRDARRIPSSTLTSLPTRRSKEGDVLDHPSEYFAKAREEHISVLTRCCRTCSIAWRKYIILTEFRLPVLPWVSKRTRAFAATEIGWTVGYTAGVIVLSFYDTDWDLDTCAKQTGWISIAQIPLIIALAGKNNFISMLTGISYEKLNFLHRAAGKVCLLGSWFHTIAYIYLLGGISPLQLQTSLTTWGMISTLALSLMYLSSIRAVRQRIYEFFLVAHICLAALFLAGVIMHWSAVSIWVYPGIGLWAADRLLRLTRLFLPPLSSSSTLPHTGTVSLLTPSTIKLTLPTRLQWKAGQHFFVLLPTLSRLPWETHPFTAAGIPGDGEVSFIVRVRDGMTGRMKAVIDAGGDGVVEGRVEGPYGETKCLRGVDGVLIFAGGSGISFAISHLLRVIADAKAGKSACRQAKIIWMVQSELHLNWVQPLLLPALSDLPPSINIELHVHVTKRQTSSLPAQSGLPTNPTAAEAGDWRTYIEERTAKPPLRSRMLSTASWTTFGRSRPATAGTGVGTRRGSEAVLKGLEESSPTELEKEGDEEKSIGDGRDSYEMPTGPEIGVVLPTFTWSDGYGGATLPTQPAEFGGLRIDPPHRSRLVANPDHRTRLSSYDSATSRPASTPVSPARRASHISTAGGVDEPVFLNHARTRNISFIDEAASPKRTRFSIDLETPASSPGPRRGSEPNIGRKLGRQSLALASPTTLRKSSLAIASSADNESDSDHGCKHSFERKPGTPTDLQISIISPRPVNFSRPLPLQLQLPSGGTSMARSSTADSFSSFTAHTQAPLLPLMPPPVSSGTATPSTALPPLPTNAQNENDIRRLSSGLEEFVKWHQGRAEPEVIIRHMKSQLKRGRMEVMVCGPTSLIVAVKQATRSEMGMRDVWSGGVRLGFHSEDFGW